MTLFHVIENSRVFHNISQRLNHVPLWDLQKSTSNVETVHFA